MKRTDKKTEASKTLIGAVREFILSCPFIKEFEDAFPVIGVENLAEEVDSYMIEALPVNPVIKQYLDGSSIRQFAFVLASRELNGENEVNIENNQFYEKFSEWLDKCTRTNVFPELGEHREAMKINATTCGYVFNADETKATYQIQCNMKYYQKVGGN